MPGQPRSGLATSMEPLLVDAVLFDLDGTLVDESASYRQVIRLTAEYMLGQPVTADEVEAVKRVPGFNNDFDATWALVRVREGEPLAPPSSSDRANPRFLALCDAFGTYYLGDRVFTNVYGQSAPFRWNDPYILKETSLVGSLRWDDLSQYRLGIATSRPRVEALMALEQHRLNDVFPQDVVVAAEDAPSNKPDPAPLHVLARRLGCKHPVYVGDSVNDALAALAAGMPFVGIGLLPFGNDDLDARVRYRIRSVEEIPALCRPLSEAGASA